LALSAIELETLSITHWQISYNFIRNVVKLCMME